jgi:hypothetical protein
MTVAAKTIQPTQPETDRPVAYVVSDISSSSSGTMLLDETWGVSVGEPGDAVAAELAAEDERHARHDDGVMIGHELLGGGQRAGRPLAGDEIAELDETASPSRIDRAVSTSRRVVGEQSPCDVGDRRDSRGTRRAGSRSVHPSLRRSPSSPT